jgi:ribosomal protein S18 acetylase RimI-like enzyme
MIMLRPLDWPVDRAAVLALDTSYVTDRVFRLELTGRAAAMIEQQLPCPIRRSYPLADDVDDLPHYDRVWVAEDRDAVAGVAALKLEQWNRRARLEHLYVAPSARGRGIGRALVGAAAEAARELGARGVWAETQTTNYGAIRFYERAGFEWCGLDTSLYDAGAVGVGELGVFFWRAVGDDR